MKRITLVCGLLILVSLTAWAQEVQQSAATANQSTQTNAAADDDELLIKAIKSGDLGQVIKLLDAGADPNATGDGDSALIMAVESNRADIAEILLNRGAKADPEKADEGSALQLAAAMGSAKLVKLLIAHGADVNYQKDHDGYPPLVLAAFGAMIKSTPEWLARSFFDMDEDDKLFRALGSEHLESAKLLIEAGADVNARISDSGQTALMCAAMGGDVEMARLILDHHADPNLENGDETALQLAEELDSPEVLAKQLNQHDDEDKQALLSWAHFTAPGRKAVAAMLRKAGATH